MDKYPNRSPDDEPLGPEPERLWPGEIDMTGAVSQEDSLADVIGDAIAEAANGELPDWGARTIARDLANRHPESFGALHHYAITGNIDHVTLAHELAAFANSRDHESHRLGDVLGTYLISQPAGRPDRQTGRSPADLTAIELGLREHGAAFWAYLQLPDTRADNPDLLANFTSFYVGAYDSMDDLTTDLVGGVYSEAELLEQAIDGITFEHLVREAWDIVPFQGRLHVFIQ
jgi:hypothetical protein